MRHIRLLALLAMPAVVSTAHASLAIDASYRGWIDQTAAHFSLGNYAVGTNGNIIVRNWFVFDLSAVALPILSAQLHFFNPPDGYISDDPTEDYVLYDVTTDIELLINGWGGVESYDDLGSGTMYASYVASASDNDTTIVISLNADAIAELNQIDGLWAIGGALESLDDDPLNIELLFGTTADVPFSDTQLVLTLIPAPGAAALLLAGLLGLTPRRRRA